MTKYEPLRDFLREQSTDSLTLTFTQLDALVRLPASAKRYDSGGRTRM